METPSTHAEEIRKRLEAYVADKPFILNPDPMVVDSIIKAMDMRFTKNGRDYCPCRRVTGDEEKDAAIVCPCVYHITEIEEEGNCHCHLFVKK